MAWFKMRVKQADVSGAIRTPPLPALPGRQHGPEVVLKARQARLTPNRLLMELTTACEMP